MKETTKMSRAICQLEKMYNVINTEKFDGSLPTPIITIQSKPGTFGHCTCNRVWVCKDNDLYELNISAENCSCCIEEIIDTMIHEMIHLYCRINGLKETSRGNTYHNKLFKQLAEEKGLKCIPAGQYGWNTQGEGNEYLVEYALSHDWTELKIGRDAFKKVISPTGMSQYIQITTGEVTTPTQSSTRKYQCPNCKNSCRATKSINIMCMDCNMKMEVVK